MFQKSDFEFKKKKDEHTRRFTLYTTQLSNRNIPIFKIIIPTV